MEGVACRSGAFQPRLQDLSEFNHPDDLYRTISSGSDIVLVFMVVHDHSEKPALLHAFDQGTFSVSSRHSPAILCGLHTGIAANALGALLNDLDHGSGRQYLV